MKISEIRKKYIEFYKMREHADIGSASLVPQNDPTTLFTGSGMQPLVPFLLGEKHPMGVRLVNSQKAFRSGDIEDIGDNRHTTYFEMLGNWSLGSYFKKEQLPWVFQFLTEVIGLDPKKLYVTAFIGDEKNNIPKDTESVEIWQGLFSKIGIDSKSVEIGSEANGYKVGMQGGRIFYYDAKKNWWSRSGVPENMPVGEPGGPDSEIFYEFENIMHDVKFGENCHPNCDCGRYMEIGNSVFMEYKKSTDGFIKLSQRNVDFGGGLERIAAASNGTPDIFKIDVLIEIINYLEKISGKNYFDQNFTSAFRVVADHIRSATFLIGDGVLPSNSDQGYFVRRLIRRAVRYLDVLGVNENTLSKLVKPLLKYYEDSYPKTVEQGSYIEEEIRKEEGRFRKTLKEGLKNFEKICLSNTDKKIAGKDAFNLYQTYGFPIEIIVELAKERGISVDVEGYKIELNKHQDLSRAGSEMKFKGGLGGTGVMETRYHTATHLLNSALKKVLGNHISQKGSNITAERLRFDFSHNAKMTDDEKKRVEDLINEKIQENLPVTFKDMPKDEALKTGAEHAFNDNYGDIVKVYSIGDGDKTFSREFCGGPHVSNTGELGKFKIEKEEAVSSGVRRIKATLK